MYRLNWQQVTDTLLLKWKQKEKKKKNTSISPLQIKKGIVQHAHTFTHTHTRARDHFWTAWRTNATAALLASALARTRWPTISYVNEANVRNVMALQCDFQCLFNAYRTVPVATLHTRPQWTSKVAKQTITAFKKKEKKGKWKKENQRWSHEGTMTCSDLDKNKQRSSVNLL